MRTLLITVARCLAGFAVLRAPAALAQQQAAIPRFDLYTGFSDLYTPGLNNINQVGFHLQAGVNASRWLAYGFDYSTQHGSTNLTPGIATRALQQELGAELPPGYNLSLPLDATIQTFTAGGQVVIRHFHQVTIFVRPVLAAFHIRATAHPDDPINTLVAAQLAPTGTLTDWYGAYGAGGGLEVPVTRHFGARVQLDAGWNHPFTNILGSGNWSYRYSVGPAFHFGRPLAK